ncbi:MAG: DUF2149 domain-containing protein [Bacteroidales bacterium]|nr:DUF2149 domain-containing protein [Bacteroidales bacterium]
MGLPAATDPGSRRQCHPRPTGRRRPQQRLPANPAALCRCRPDCRRREAASRHRRRGRRVGVAYELDNGEIIYVPE